VLLAALGDTAQRSNGLRCIAGAEHLSGRTVEAEAAIAAALARDTGPPATSFLPYTLVTAADLALGRGDAEEALDLAERADALLAHHASDRWRSAARVIAARTALGRPPGDLRALEAWRAAPLGPPHDRGVVWFALARARAARRPPRRGPGAGGARARRVHQRRRLDRARHGRRLAVDALARRRAD
jgi:hypothetical protein